MTEYAVKTGTTLVIGYGNELRCDDGIGLRVSQAIAAEDYPGVRVVTCFQLVPELAADLAEARRVIFVDASADPGRSHVELRPITDNETNDWSTHSSDPRALLALTHAVYGRSPEAWWVMVPGEDFGFGEMLSGRAQENVRQAIALIAAWIEKGA